MNTKLFTERVLNLTTFLLIERAEGMDLIVNKETSQLYLFITNTKQLVPLGVRHEEKFGPLHAKEKQVYHIV